MRDSIVTSTFNNCKVCVGSVMLVILRWRVFRIHKQWHIPMDHSDFRQFSITNKKTVCYIFALFY
jgi:hypothetical protein